METRAEAVRRLIEAALDKKLTPKTDRGEEGLTCIVLSENASNQR